MSLRVRVVALFGVVLLISVVMGAVFAAYEAKTNLKEELASGLLGARQTVQSAFEDLPRSEHPEQDLRQLVATFNGNRHVTARLMDPTGRVLDASRTVQWSPPAPRWFARLLDPSTPDLKLSPPRLAAGLGRPAGAPILTSSPSLVLVLRPVAALDVAAEWRLFCGIVLVVLVSAVTGLIMVYLLIGAALRPLQTLSAEFVHIGAGDYRGRLTARGPSELLSLQTGFNAMVAQLANMTDRNRLLTEQLLTLQDEERADVARDLHDEIGPHLFAVNMDAEMIAQLSAAAGNAAVLHQARAIQGAVSHMQRQVRDLLGRLRPTPVTELGLRAAVDDLVRFWAERRPDIRFQVDLAEDGLRLSEGLKEVAYRVIQEGVNNAVRHGAPRSVEIKVTSNPEELHVLVQDDGVGSGTAPKAGGLGLVGMRERVAANGGRLVFGPRSEKGWSVMARLPSLGSAPETAQKPTPEAAPDQKVA